MGRRDQDKKNGETRHKRKKMGRQDARQKNGEMRCKTKKNGEMRRKT